jgi:hypothetical protein
MARKLKAAGSDNTNFKAISTQARAIARASDSSHLKGSQGGYGEPFDGDLLAETVAPPRLSWRSSRRGGSASKWRCPLLCVPPVAGGAERAAKRRQASQEAARRAAQRSSGGRRAKRRGREPRSGRAAEAQNIAFGLRLWGYRRQRGRGGGWRMSHSVNLRRGLYVRSYINGDVELHCSWAFLFSSGRKKRHEK